MPRSRSHVESRLSTELWSADDGDVGKRRRLRNADDALFLQHQQSMELRSGVLARDLARWNNGRECRLGCGAGATELSSQHLVHFSGVCSAARLQLLSVIQLIQLHTHNTLQYITQDSVIDHSPLLDHEITYLSIYVTLNIIIILILY